MVAAELLAGARHARLRHRRHQWRDGGQQQQAEHQRQPGPHDGRRLRFSQARHQHDDGASAAQHKGKRERPARQRRQ